jgi:hypothetical protein
MVKFVIVTTQRTGTTFFRTCLDSHPQIQCPGTVFPQETKFRFFQIDRPGSIYHQYRSRSLKRQLVHWFRRKKIVYDCLNDFYARRTDTPTVGFKASYNHLQRYPAITAWIKENDVRVIHFIRRNLLKRFLSEQSRRARGLAHSSQAVKPVKVHVDIGRLQKDLTKKAQLVERYRKIFADKPYLEVVYESFTANREVETQRILQFLGVNELMPLESKLVKLNPDSLEDIIENYDQVTQALQNTPFAGCLEA